MFDYFSISGLIVAIVFLCWLGFRAWRAKRRLFRWMGTPLAGLLALVCAAVLVVALIGYRKLNRQYDNPASTISVDMTIDRIARGERLVHLCAGCHGGDKKLPLVGRDFLAEEDAPPIGRMYAPNLTPAHLGDWTDGEIIRAIREGVNRNGNSLLIMPSSIFRRLSDDDVAAIVAYLRSQPAVEPDSPRRSLNLLGAIMVNLAPVFQVQPTITEPVVAPPVGVTSEYGEYLVSFSCASCHGEDLGGNVDFDVPPLMASGLAWSEEDFLSFFGTGVRPSGAAVDGELMPWEDLRAVFVDDELRAVFLYIKRRFSSLDG